MSEQELLLDVEDLQTFFHTENGVVRAVDGVSFSVNKGEIVAIVGESGCGKSVTAFSLIDLISPPGKIEGGKVMFEEEDLTKYSKRQMRQIRGNEVSMIFQEPLTSLNPVFTIGHQISEAILLHQDISKVDARKLGINMLKRVGIPRAEQVYASYPHSLSGGMRQRAMIAMALSCNPKLLIADEPTTALDVTIQAQILYLLKELSETLGTSIILITHDLGVVADLADRVIVMYAGQVVEERDVYKLFAEPKHPYTQGLLDSTPRIHDLKDELTSIKGTVPTPEEMPRGCRFQPRCPMAMDICREKEPSLTELDTGEMVRCWLHDPEVAKDEQTTK